MRFLITGFPPFPGRPTNPTQLLIASLNQEASLFGHEFKAVLLPVEYQGVETAFETAVSKFDPDVVLSFGVGRHSQTLRLESRGENLDDATIPDNAGELRQGSTIVESGTAHLNCSLDFDRLSTHLLNSKIACEISYDAGRYVCNHLLYYAIYLQQFRNQSFRFLFTHLPTEENGFDLNAAVRGIEKMVDWFSADSERD